MRFFQATGTVVLIFSTVLSLYGQGAPAKDASAELKGIPPRATPADYQAHAEAGTLTIAAEFTGHSLPTAEGPLTTEDYVAVEVALFGPAGTSAKISASDFSLRVNGKKTPLSAQPSGVTFSSLKDPEWVPPEAPEKKSKSSIGGGGNQDSGPPPPAKMPFPLQRAMQLRVRKAALPEGDRSLPQAGLLFFPYRGKEKNMQSIELLYEGAAGKATLNLQP